MPEESEDHLLHAVAGALGSAAALALTYPLYLATLRQQADHGLRTSTESSLSLFHLLGDVVQKDGMGGLFQGCTEGLWAITAQNFVYYYLFAAVKHWHKAPDGSAAWNLVTGYEAGVMTVLTTHPLWVVNYQLTTSRKAEADTSESSNGPPQIRRSSLSSSLKRIVKEQGIQGLYAGVVPAIVLCTNPAIQFSMFAASSAAVRRSRRARKRRNLELSSADVFVLGAWAKAVASVLTFPVQVVKTSLSKAAGAGGKFEGPLQCVCVILREEGPGAFFKGLRSKLLQTALMAALTFSIRLRLLAMLRHIFTRRRRLHLP